MWLRRLRASTLALYCTVMGSPCFATRADDEHLAKLADQHNFTEGLKYCEQVLRREPHSFWALTYHALFRYWSGDAPGGESEMQHVVRLFPERYDSKVHLANMYLSKGEVNEGIAMARSAAQIDKGDGTAHIMLAQLYLTGLQFELALKEAEIGLTFHKPEGDDICSTIKLGALFALGKTAEATKYAHTLDFKKVRWEFIDPIGNYLLTHVHPREVITLESWSLQYNPKKVLPYYLLAYAYSNLDNLTESEKAAKELWKLAPHHIDGRIAMCNFYTHKGMYKDAEDCLKAILPADAAKRVGVWETAYKLHIGQQNYEEAIKDLNHMMALSNPIEKVAVIAKRGDTYLMLGDTAKALSEYTAAIKAAPNNGEWYRKRAALYDELNNCKAAEADRRKAESLH